MEAPELINPLRSQNFIFQLKISINPRSKLTDVARKHLYEDYLYLQTQEQKRRVEELKAWAKVDNRGKGSFDGNRLAAHYRVSLNSMYNILKRRRTTVDTGAKKRPGRTRVLTSLMENHVVEKDQQVGGTTLRTLRGILDHDLIPGYQTRYKGRVINTPSVSTLSKLKKSPAVSIKRLRTVPMITEQAMGNL